MLPPRLFVLLSLTACSPPWTETDLSVRSDVVDDTYDVRVVVPDAGVDGPWPVLVFQDGDYWPRYQRVLTEALNNGAPPFVLVAVGYQNFHTGLTGGLTTDALDRRLRDTTEEEIEGYPGTGGADAYQTFLDAELLPAVAAELDLELADDRTQHAIYGYSVFGLAVTQSLLRNGPTFGGYCAGSPSLRRFDAPIFEAEDDPAAGTLSGWARFTIGSTETEDLAGLDAFLDWFDDGDHPDLTIGRDTFDGKNHRGAQKPAFRACLDDITRRW